MNLIQKILYKRKRWYVKRKRYKRKYSISFKQIKVMWDYISNIHDAHYDVGVMNASDALTNILISSQKSFRIYYFDDNDVFDMIKIVEQIRDRCNYDYKSMVCFKLINDLIITNSELYVKYRLLLT